MKQVHITGASQRVSKNASDEWCAWYECHKCGDEFACSSEFCRNEATAREESNTSFNKQQRRFCFRCGYKLTTSEPAPDDAYIAELNRRIDRLQERCREKWERIKTLQDAFNGLSDAERIAVSKGWIRAVPCDDQQEGESATDE